MESLAHQLTQSFKEGILAQTDFAELRALLIQFKAAGGTEAQAYQVLTDLLERHDWTEEQDDLVREVMDIASGWCSPHMRVW